jgi:putative acetyltransferase
VSSTPIIRLETVEDIPGIRNVIRAAFGRSGESDLVEGLRRSGALIVSAVALSDGRVVGHVAFSGVTVGRSGRAVGLAPVAVTPNCQGNGVGSALIRWGLEECGRLGHKVVIVLGDPGYYGRFGFATASRFGIECPFSVPAEEFMVLELSVGAASGICGMVRYAPEFELV